MQKFLGLICAAAIIFSCSTSFAEELIEASGNYVMDSRLDETPASATSRAREEAKRAAIEKAGIYLQTHSKTVDFELVEDEVETVAARLLKIQSESSDVEVVEKNLLKFTVTIKAIIDELDEAELKAIMQNKQTLAEETRKYKELQKEYDALKKQMEQLKRDYDTADDAQKIEIKKKVNRNSMNFSAVDATSRGNDFYYAKDYAQALAAYDEAVMLNPTYAEAYNNRGIVKYELGQYVEAISNYTMAIKLNPQFFFALNNRGNARAALGQFKDAEQDLKAALNLNNNNAAIHNNLGSVYYSLKNYDAALDEYTQAIKLNPNFAEAYYNRAAIHYGQKKFFEALADIKNSLSLNGADGAAQDLLNKISSKVG